MIVRETRFRCFPSQVICCVGVRVDFGDRIRFCEDRKSAMQLVMDCVKEEEVAMRRMSS